MAGGSIALVGEAGSAGAGVSLVVLLVAGTVVMVWVLGVFLAGERFSRPGAALSRKELGELRRRAEAGISALAPGAIRLSEKERAAGFAEVARDSEARTFWRRYGGASGLVEEDPAAALRELHGLPALLERALENAGRETGCAEGVRTKEEEA